MSVDYHKKINTACDRIEKKEQLTNRYLSEIKSLIGTDYELAKKLLKFAVEEKKE